MSAEGVGNKVRRIAILVTSLDASAGRQLLMAMPTELARQVRRAMTQLGHVDPVEQRQILAEFRMQAMTAGDGNTASIPTASKQDKTSPVDPPVTLDVAQKPERQAVPQFETGSSFGGAGREPGLAPSGLGGVNFNALGELLRSERATVVAVVINQLDPPQAAELLGMLPKPLQREVIVNLPRLGQIDPDAMAAIDEHLATRIADYHHRRAGESESTSRMHDLLAAATPDLRSEWQSTLLHAEPHLASRMGITAPPPVSRATPANNTAVDQSNAGTQAAGTVQSPVPANSSTVQAKSSTVARPAARGASMLDLLANNVVTTADLRVAKSLATPNVEGSIDQSVAQLGTLAEEAHEEAHEEAQNDRARILPFTTQATVLDSDRSIRFEQILDLPAEDIGQILAAADTDVILYALAGASPAFMKRFMAMLDRADGRALQSRLKQLRAINLKDVDAAQRRICQLAYQRQHSNAA